MKTDIHIVIVDDHKLFRKGLVELVRMLDPNFKIIAEFDHGKQLLEGLSVLPVKPDLVILDIDMPVMDGYETLAAIQNQNIDLPALIVTMVDEEASLIRMVKLGARGYLSKEIDPEQLKEAIHAIIHSGYHFTDRLTGRLVAHLQHHTPETDLNDRDLNFVRLCCTELTYTEIADQMHLSPKTIDGYRAKLFERFALKSRVGLVLLAVKKKWLE